MSQIRPLAEQQLVDCSPAGKPTNGGCKGAAPITVLQWLRDNKVEWGLDDSYPYTATVSKSSISVP